MQQSNRNNRLAGPMPFQNSLPGRPRSKLKKLECIEPLAETAQPTTAAAAPIQPAASRPIDLTLNGNLLDKEKATPLKRATYIVDRSPTNGEAEEPGDLQSVAALRQAARKVFLASPRESPLPTHKQSV